MFLGPLSSILQEMFFFPQVTASMASHEWNSDSGKQGSGPGCSPVLPPAPELLSSHHVAE